MLKRGFCFAFLLLVILVFLVGCGTSTAPDKTEKENKSIEAPVVEGFELVETEESSGFIYFFYIGDLPTDEALDLFSQWALDNGWHEDETSRSWIRVFNKEGYTRKIGIISEGGSVDYPGKTNIRFNFPRS